MDNALMDYMEAYRLLNRYKIRSIDSKYVGSADDAVKFSAGKPIAIKALSQKALHKTKSGLVALNLGDEKEIRSAYSAISKKAQKFKPYKIIAQKMVERHSENLEIIVGGRADQQFGKLILIGLGGIYVEAFRDFSLRVCPISGNDADDMINELKSRNVIAKTDKEHEMIKALLLKVSKMLSENRINELDLNPVILHDGTYDAVDLRILR